MKITVQLPDDIASRIGDSNEIPRRLLEALAAESYRTGRLTRHEVGVLLGRDYWGTDEFLTAHSAQRPYSLADIDVDRQSLASMDAP